VPVSACGGGRRARVGPNIVVDVPLAAGGSERVLFAGPANPPAILVMLAGGDEKSVAPSLTDS
jgi:hypothetical protein